MEKTTFLILDSGVGGLTIWHEIQQRIPNSNACYVADNAAFPYGTQEEPALIERLLELLPPLEQHYQPDIIVIACNTASTVVLEPLRAQTRTPIIGVVPAIKPAAQLSQTKHIALLATPGTIKRRYTQQLIEDFGKGCNIIKLGSHQLVHEAEKKLRGLAVDKQIIQTALQDITDAQQPIDVVVLGCTHFPFLLEEITQQLPAGITVIDSGQAIARRAQQLLEDINHPHNHADIPAKNSFLFTADNAEAHTLEPGIKQFGFDKIQFLNQSTTQNTQKSGAS